MDLEEPDPHTPEEQALDEQLASEAPRAPISLPPGARPSPMEAHLHRKPKRPMAHMGVVEDGVVRLLEPGVRLPEGAKVIIVAPEA